MAVPVVGTACTIPFTNAMPAWAILLLAIGMLMAGQNISTLFG